MPKCRGLLKKFRDRRRKKLINPIHLRLRHLVMVSKVGRREVNRGEG